MAILSGILFTLVIFFLLCTVSVSAFVFSGYVLTQLVDLTMFEATIVCIGASFVAGFLIALFKISEFLTKIPKKLSDDYHDDDDEEEKKEETVRKRRDRFKVVRSEKVGRNTFCPCGSGKKYKNCCGA
ncbi:SEC-C metal-binding domain-containing protein [Desulfococcaceae bacterium HSG9]|nr:SEC-C metal-binding domain-containing protein [Desulfococcaceae bacterium HSG9]